MSYFCDSPASKLVWKIENFSGHKTGSLVCPVHIPTNAKWEVVISKGNHHISVFLRNWQRYKSTFYCSFAFLDCNGRPLICKETEINASRAFDDLHEAFIFPNQATFYPNDTLRVECRVWRKVLAAGGDVSPVILFVRTRIETIRKTFTCVIPEIKESSSTFTKTISKGHNLEIEICIPFSGPVSASLTTTLTCNAKIEISVVDNTGEQNTIGKYDVKFDKNSCLFNIDLSRNTLTQHADKFLVSGTLSLIFTCTFTGPFGYSSVVEETEIFESTTPLIASATAVSEVLEAELTSDKPKTSQENEPVTIIKTLQEILSKGYFSDFNLKVGDRTFPVHKSILGMRSKVFHSMFTSEMKEAQDSCADIKDVDGDTFHRLLQFIYSDRIDKAMDWSEASSLYAAADFYALEPLKKGCSGILESNLSPTSALGVLALADLHQDQHLKSAALDFIFLNDEDIVDTEDWVKFEEENVKLAMETLRKLYKKMKG